MCGPGWAQKPKAWAQLRRLGLILWVSPALSLLGGLKAQGSGFSQGFEN